MGVLSTHSQAHPGYPFGSVVPYCLDNVGFPLLLLSHLAQHTRNLMAEPRCALTLAEPTPGDVQQSTRLGCVADCRPLASQAEGARYFRYYAAAKTYLEQLDFRLFRFVPEGGAQPRRRADPLDSPRPSRALRSGPLRKYQRRFPGFYEKIIALDARGMSARDIQTHVGELYDVTISAELVSAVTDSVIDEIRAWQFRPIDPPFNPAGVLQRP